MTRLEEFTIYRSQGMTYKEIAEKCGVSRQYIDRLLDASGLTYEQLFRAK